MCQGCVDAGRLAQSTYDAIEAFMSEWPDADFGPAHITLSDDNVDDLNLFYCLHELETELWAREQDGGKETPYEGHTLEELKATKVFLLKLLAIPEDVR